MNLIHLIIGWWGKDGIQFGYDGDWIIWLWPWRRNKTNGMALYSLSFNFPFKSYAELDREWENYIIASYVLQRMEEDEYPV